MKQIYNFSKYHKSRSRCLLLLILLFFETFLSNCALPTQNSSAISKPRESWAKQWTKAQNVAYSIDGNAVLDSVISTPHIRSSNNLPTLEMLFRFITPSMKTIDIMFMENSIDKPNIDDSSYISGKTFPANDQRNCIQNSASSAKISASDALLLTTSQAELFAQKEGEKLIVSVFLEICDPLNEKLNTKAIWDVLYLTSNKGLTISVDAIHGIILNQEEKHF